MRWKYLTLYVEKDGSPQAYEEDEEGRKELCDEVGRHDMSLFDAVNQMGFHGWELVTSIVYNDGQTLLFKQPLG